jgi:hypothetical protein
MVPAEPTLFLLFGDAASRLRPARRGFQGMGVGICYSLVPSNAREVLRSYLLELGNTSNEHRRISIPLLCFSTYIFISTVLRHYRLGGLFIRFRVHAAVHFLGETDKTWDDQGGSCLAGSNWFDPSGRFRFI